MAKNFKDNVIDDSVLAVSALSEIAGISFQRSIDDSQLVDLEILIHEWHAHLRKYFDSKDFTTNQHSLEHLSKVAKKVGLAQTSCASLERKRQCLKYKISSKEKHEKVAANILFETTNRNYQIRSNVSYSNVESVDIKSFFKYTSDASLYRAYKLKQLLADITPDDISAIIIYAFIVKFYQKVFYDSIIHSDSRRWHYCDHALVKACSGDEFYIAMILLVFEHQQIGDEEHKYFVLLQFYDQVSVSLGDNLYCDGNCQVNMSTITDSPLLKVIPSSRLLSSVATLKLTCELPEYNNRIYFFWPHMIRSNLKIYERLTSFGFEDSILIFNMF